MNDTVQYILIFMSSFIGGFIGAYIGTHLGNMRGNLREKGNIVEGTMRENSQVEKTSKMKR